MNISPDMIDDDPAFVSRGKEVYTVSELTRHIRTLLETALPVLWVEGEISNFKHHSSGHMYFSLKDESSQIPCVMWASRNSRLSFTPEDGMKVLVEGRITVYERRGYYQLDVLQVQPAGVGALQLAFEQLKQKLAAEGLFAPENKKPIPRYPARIGIVTSPTGAAIRDLVSVIRRRWPQAQIILRPARVQGDGAAADIAAAVEECNAYGELDVLIVGRGGGSLEDLWAFNEEVVARAIHASQIPIVSAVGHEIDFTIADFAADLRAPTPSAAAELVAPDRDEIMHRLERLISRAYQLVRARVLHQQEKLKGLVGSYAFRRPLDILREYSQTLDDLQRRAETAVQQKIERDRMRLEALRTHLQALSYHDTLKRGFVLTKDAATGAFVKRASETRSEQNLKLVYHDGTVDATVD